MARVRTRICGFLALVGALGAAATVAAQADLSAPVFAADALVAPGALANPACQAAQRYTQFIALGRADLIGGLFSAGAVYYGAGDDPLQGVAAIADFYALLIARSQPRGSNIKTLVPAGAHDCYMELSGSLKDYRPGASGQQSVQPLPGAIDRFTVDDQGKVTRLYIFFRPQTFELLKAAVTKPAR